LRAEWRTHYEKKIQAELDARLSNYAAFLEDYADDPQRGRSGYPAEATHRIILEQLQLAAEELEIWEEDDYEERLNRLDKRLKSALEEKELFILADALLPVYPKYQYWWLYAYPEVD